MEQMNWAKLLLTAGYTYNNSWNYTIRTTPFRAMYGYDPDFHIDFDVADDATRRAPAALDRIKRLQDLQDSLKAQ